jgi:hypothetical protein
VRRTSSSDVDALSCLLVQLYAFELTGMLHGDAAAQTDAAAWYPLAAQTAGLSWSLTGRVWQAGVPAAGPPGFRGPTHDYDAYHSDRLDSIMCGAVRAGYFAGNGALRRGRRSGKSPIPPGTTSRKLREIDG